VPPTAVSVADTPAAAASATGTAVTAAPAAVVAALAQADAPGEASVPAPGEQALPQQAAPAQDTAVQAAPVQTAPGEADPAQSAPVQAVPAQNAPVAQPTVPDARPANQPPPVAPVAPVADQTTEPQAAPAQAAPVVAAAATPQSGADQQQDAGAQQQQPAGPNGIQPVPAHTAPAPAPVAHAAHVSPLRTAETVERIHALVQLANANGAAQARLQLHPAELGGVTIQLRVTAAGLQAHIAADRPEALPLLQQAGDELRKSLADRGVEVNHLDFGMRGDAQAGAWREQSRAQQELADGFDAGPLTDGDEPLDAVPTATGEAPAGVLVDVKA
jgi:flagellar hook-length control protein FliK